MVLGVLAARGTPHLQSRTTAAVVVLAALATGLVAATVSHPLGNSRLSLATVDIRTNEWSAAYKQLSAHPVIGGGPERNLVLRDKRSFAYFAHNEYLQIGAGAGLVALALLALIIITAARIADRRTWQSEAATAALLVFAVGGLPWGEDLP